MEYGGYYRMIEQFYGTAKINISGRVYSGKSDRKSKVAACRISYCSSGIDRVAKN